LRRILRFYESRGYYQARIVRNQVTPQNANGVALEVEIAEGDPTRVGAIDISGLDALPEADRSSARPNRRSPWDSRSPREAGRR